jgi:RNA polymerase sigma-70 factor, ECF subfamily
MSSRRSQLPISLVPGTSHREVTDGDLARSLQAGEGWALVEAWRRFAPMVLTMSARALGSQSEADDVAQEVFHRVFRKIGTILDPSCLRSFVFSFAVRVLKTELRRKKSARWLSFHRPEVLFDASCQTADMESRDLLRRFYALLDRLSARDRLVFAFRHMERMTVEEIAASLKLSPSTVKRSLAHATEKLARWVESDLGIAGFLSETLDR